MNDVETGGYWFPARRYGWGWGWPTAWQGWVVFAVYFAAVTIAVFLFLLPGDTSAFSTTIIVLTWVLIAVCWIKGEPPKWRWGEDRSS